MRLLKIIGFYWTHYCILFRFQANTVFAFLDFSPSSPLTLHQNLAFTPINTLALLHQIYLHRSDGTGGKSENLIVPGRHSKRTWWRFVLAYLSVVFNTWLHT